MTKFTPEYIAKCRKAKGSVGHSLAISALDEIERSHDMIQQLIEAGNTCAHLYRYIRIEGTVVWDALVAEWKEQQ